MNIDVAGKREDSRHVGEMRCSWMYSRFSGELGVLGLDGREIREFRWDGVFGSLIT